MIPAPFQYLRARSLDEALRWLSEHGDEAKLLAGGHSLIPTMKLRLAQPKVLIDLGRVSELRYIREKNGKLAIGALTTHHEIESSELLRKKCLLMPEVASQIGDVQVRNRGTIGGSLAHADPAADWPAAILALEAEIEIAGPQGQRSVRAQDFFVDLFQTALQSNELLREIRVPATPYSVAYVKFTQRASGFALAGAAAVIDGKTSRVGITGIAAKAYRADAVEKELAGKPLTPVAISIAAKKAGAGVDALSDIHGSAEYRLHLAQVATQRALQWAASRGA